MRYIVIALLALVLGVWVARSYYKPKEQEPVDPVTVIVMQMKTHAIIEHERQVAVWYRACPDVVGVNPEIFIAWPAKLSYELELADVSIERSGDTLKVHARAIRPDEPAVPTDFLDYLSTSSMFTFANEQELVNHEIQKASGLARYLTTYYLLRDESLRGDFETEVQGLVMRLAGALGVPVTHVEVDIAREDLKLPKLPKLELCTSSAASVNGLPFARLEDANTVPIAFKPPPSKRSPQSTAGAAQQQGNRRESPRYTARRRPRRDADTERGVDLRRCNARLVGDHLFDAVEVGHQRCLVDHAHLADDRRAIGEDARVVRPHHIRAHAHELREALRDEAEVAGVDPRAHAWKHDDARAARGRRNVVAAGAFERHERHLPAVPGHRAHVPGRRARHLRRRDEADHFGDTGARNDQPPVDERNQQAVDLGDAFGHGRSVMSCLARASPTSQPARALRLRWRSTSGAMASSSCASWYGLPR